MVKKTNSDIKKLKQLAADYKNHCKKGEELEKSIEKFFREVQSPRELIQELYKIPLPEISYYWEGIMKECLKLNFPEIHSFLEKINKLNEPQDFPF